MRVHKNVVQENGFTLTELLVVIVIIGILVGLVVPRYMTQTTRAKATEAKLMLKEVYNLQKAHYLENDVWGKSLEEIGFEQQPLKTKGGNARYRIELVTVSDTGYIATATSVIDFDKDGNFNQWSINQKNKLMQAVPD